MTHKILVTYASRTGWTVGVAEAIGKSLSDSETPVDVLPMQEVNNLPEYSAVVAGSAINAGAWLPGAMNFIRTHQTELRQKPFAAFLVCMTLSMKNGERYRAHVSTWLDPVRQLLHPVSEGFFAGGLELRRIPSAADRLKFRLSILFGAWKAGDHRDCKAISDWAAQLKPLLKT